MTISRLGLFKGLITVLPFLLLVTCETPEQPEEVKPDIQIPSGSQTVFSTGISFGASSGNLVQSFSFSFTATDSWTADITETRASSWLSVEPSSGGAGVVNMTVMALANPSEDARSATVTLRCGEVQKSFTVRQEGAAVTPPPPSGTIPVTSITLNKTALYLEKDQIEQLIATVKPDNATNKDVSWSSSNDAVAIVDRDGKVTGVSDGNATITATADGKSATCAVTVTVVIPVESITLDQPSLTLLVGETYTLTATVTPDNASDKTVTWSSSNNGAAKVDQNGTVTGVAEGKAEITASAGGKSTTCSVTVNKSVVGATALELDLHFVTLERGQKATLVATVFPRNATDQKIRWTTSNSTTATVDDNGVVTALDTPEDRKTTITATLGEKGHYQATCEVTIARNVVPVTGISLNKSAITLLEDQTETLVATVTPLNATDTRASWSTSNPDVATVDYATGEVLAKHEGTANIIATAGNKVQAMCAVTVKKKEVAVSGVSLNANSITLKVGDEYELVATVKPDTATDKTVSWSNSNSTSVSMQRIDNFKVRIKALNKPEKPVTITAKAGGFNAACKVVIE